MVAADEDNTSIGEATTAASAAGAEGALVATSPVVEAVTAAAAPADPLLAGALPAAVVWLAPSSAPGAVCTKVTEVAGSAAAAVAVLESDTEEAAAAESSVQMRAVASPLPVASTLPSVGFQAQQNTSEVWLLRVVTSLADTSNSGA